jgi:hypothetical protein
LSPSGSLAVAAVVINAAAIKPNVVLMTTPHQVGPRKIFLLISR